MFADPFEALAAMNFLPIIVFAIGIAMSLLEEREDLKEAIGLIKRISNGITNVMFKIIEWALQYAPIGTLLSPPLTSGYMGRA